MVSLPLEMFRAILLEVPSKRDLCAVARVSRSVQSEAERFIYHRLEFGSSTAMSTVVFILKRVCLSKILPLYVRHFALLVMLGFRRNSHCLATFQLLARFLGRVTRLRTLTLRLPLFLQGINVFDQCKFKLYMLDIDGLDEGFLSFIEKQTEIRIRKVGSNLEHGLLLAGSNLQIVLPNLKVLSASSDIANQLVSRSPTTHLWARDFEEEPAGYLALANPTLRSLGILLWKLPMFIAIADLLPELTALHVCLGVSPLASVVSLSPHHVG
jgi:hypothetical protein